MAMMKMKESILQELVKKHGKKKAAKMAKMKMKHMMNGGVKGEMSKRQ